MLCPALAEEFYLGRTLGYGSQGAVRILKQKVGSSVVVCKEFNLSDLDDTTFASVMYDLSLASNLQHSFLLHYDRLIVYDETNIVFAITPQIGNCNLLEFISRHKNAQISVPEACVLTILRSVAQALAFLHKEARALLFAKIGGTYTEDPILHNDLKPSNIFITENNQVLVADYGTSRTYKMKRLTSTFSDTLPYLAPEVIQRKEASEASDVWSLGCIAYELCTFKRLIERANTVAEVSAYIAGFKDCIIPKSYSKQLAKLIKQMLSVDEKARPSVSDILDNRIVATARTNVQIEHLLDSTAKTYKTANITNITARLDLDPCDVITASSAVFGGSSVHHPSNINGPPSNRGSRISSRANSAAIGRSYAKSLKAARSLASSVAFNKSFLASSARLTLTSMADTSDPNAFGVGFPSFSTVADTVVDESPQKLPVPHSAEPHSAKSIQFDLSLAHLRRLKEDICTDASNRLTSQKPYKFRGTFHPEKDKTDITSGSTTETPYHRPLNLRTTSVQVNSKPGPDSGFGSAESARLSVRLPDSLRRSASTHISLYSEDTQETNERIKEFIYESRSRLQLLDSICLSGHAATPLQNAPQSTNPFYKPNILCTPILRNSGQSFSSPSFTLDISHPDNIKWVADELASSTIEVLVPNKQRTDIFDFTCTDDSLLQEPPALSSNTSAQTSQLQMESVKPSTVKPRGLSKPKMARKHNPKTGSGVEERMSNVLISKLESSVVSKRHRKKPDCVTPDPLTIIKSPDCCPTLAPNKARPRGSISKARVPSPNLSRNRSKSMGNKSSDTTNEVTIPRYSLPADKDKPMLSIFLGDISSLKIEMSSSASTLCDQTGDAPDAQLSRKLQIPKVPTITVQRREHIRQNTSLPMVASSSPEAQLTPRSLQRKTFVPSPPPLTKPYLLGKKVTPVESAVQPTPNK